MSTAFDNGGGGYERQLCFFLQFCNGINGAAFCLLGNAKHLGVGMMHRFTHGKARAASFKAYFAVDGRGGDDFAADYGKLNRARPCAHAAGRPVEPALRVGRAVFAHCGGG